MGGEFLTWGTSISPHVTVSFLWEKEIKGNFSKNSTCDISHVKFSESHEKGPFYGMLLKVIPWGAGNFLIRDGVIARFRP